MEGTGSQRDVTDHNDSTCAVASFLEVTLNRKYSVSWVRLISTNTCTYLGDSYVLVKGVSCTHYDVSMLILDNQTACHFLIKEKDMFPLVLMSTIYTET